MTEALEIIILDSDTFRRDTFECDECYAKIGIKWSTDPDDETIKALEDSGWYYSKDKILCGECGD